MYAIALWLMLGVLGYTISGLILGKGKRVTVLLRSLVLILLCLALARPVQQFEDESKEIIVLLDVSESVSTEAQQQLVQALAPFSGSTLRILPFAGKVSGQSYLVEELNPSTLKRISGQLEPGATDIASAILSALRRFDSAGIILLTDGQETAGSALSAATEATARGVRLYPLIPNTSLFDLPRIALSGVYAPLTAPAGEKVPIRVAVQNNSNSSQQAQLEVWLEEKKLLSRSINLPKNQETLVVVETPPTEGGLQRIRATLSMQDEPNNQDELHRWLSVKEQDKILLISGHTDDHRVIPRLLSLKGYSLEDFVADGRTQFPQSFEGFRTVILNNIANRQLPVGFLNRLKTFVEAGGGLILIGGERSFGLGGYIDTPLEEISPVKFVPPQTTTKPVNSAVYLVIDKSRSMVVQNRIEYARRAALVTINAMRDDDLVGVIGFDSNPFVIMKLEKVSKVRGVAEQRLRNLTASGRTNLLPALAAARQGLSQSDAGRKHIIIMTDGILPIAGNAYVEEVQRLRNEGITVSAVALGSEADVPIMQMMAQYGRGAFYHTLDPTQLPEIFIQDVRVTTGEKTMREDDQFTVTVGPSGVQSVSLRSFPVLTGLVETRSKPGSQLELITQKNREVFPVLSSWKYKKGTVVVYTSDANGRWSLPWLRWPSFSRFWSEIVRMITTKSESKSSDIDFDFRYQLQRDTLSFDLAVFDSTLETSAPPTVAAELKTPGNEHHAVIFQQTAKGRFRAELPNARAGDYSLNIKYGDVTFPPVALTLRGDLFGEIKGKGVNVPLLSDLAHRTNGSINPHANDVEGKRRFLETERELFPPLVLLAALLLVLEVFVREQTLWALLSRLRR